MTDQIAILFDADDSPIAVNPTGTHGARVQPWTGKLHPDGSVTYGRHTYRPIRSLGSRDNGEHGTLYERIVPPGFQVLATHKQLGTITEPLFAEPIPDRDEADRRARSHVTSNLAAFGTRVRVELVWQEAPGQYGEPLAVLDAANHTAAEAIQARLQDRLLDWDHVPSHAPSHAPSTAKGAAKGPPPECERAEDAPPPPAPASPQSPQDIDCKHDTTRLDLAQVQRIGPRWGSSPGISITYGDGRGSVNLDAPLYDDLVPELEATGWRKAGSNGSYLNPAFDFGDHMKRLAAQYAGTALESIYAEAAARSG